MAASRYDSLPEQRRLFIENYVTKFFPDQVGSKDLSAGAAFVADQAFLLQEHMTAKRWKEVIVCFKPILDSNNSDFESALLYLQAVKLSKTEYNYSETLKMLQIIIEKMPLDSRPRLLLTHFQFDAGQGSEAVWNFVGALVANDADVDKTAVFEMLDRLEFLSKEPEQKEQKCATSELPKVAERLFRATNYAGATAIYDTLIIENVRKAKDGSGRKNCIGVYSRRGDAFYMRQNTLLALRDYSVAIWLHQQYMDKVSFSLIDLVTKRRNAHLSMGRLDVSLKDHDQIFILMDGLNTKKANTFPKDKIENVNKEFSRILFEKATKQSESKEIFAYLGHALSINPKNLNAQLTLGKIYFESKMESKAIAAFQKALEINPFNPIAVDHLKKLGVPVLSADEDDKRAAARRAHKKNKKDKKKANKQTEMERKEIEQEHQREEEARIAAEKLKADREHEASVAAALESERARERLERESEYNREIERIRAALEVKNENERQQREREEQEQKDKEDKEAAEKQRLAEEKREMGVIAKELNDELFRKLELDLDKILLQGERKRILQTKLPVADYEKDIFKALKPYVTRISGSSVRDRQQNGKIDLAKDVDFTTTAPPAIIMERLRSRGINRVENCPDLFRMYVDVPITADEVISVLIEIWYSPRLEQSLLADANGRDCPSNALYLDEEENLEDPTERGIFDLLLEQTTTILDPEKCFKEDPLRVFRVAYTAVSSNTKIPEPVRFAMRKVVMPLGNETEVARINSFFKKVFISSKAPEHFRNFVKENLLAKVFSSQVAAALEKDCEWICEQLKTPVVDVNRIYMNFVVSAYASIAKPKFLDLIDICQANPLFRAVFNLEKQEFDELFENAMQARKAFYQRPVVTEKPKTKLNATAAEFKIEEPGAVGAGLPTPYTDKHNGAFYANKEGKAAVPGQSSMLRNKHQHKYSKSAST